MKKLLLLISLLLFYSILLITCKKDKNIDNTTQNNEPNQNVLSQQEWIEILKADSIISISADSILLSNDPINGWNSMKNNYKNYSNVEQVSVTDKALYVKFKKGGIFCWYAPSGMSKGKIYNNNVIIKKQVSNKINGLVGNNKVCLINCLYEDEQFPNFKQFINNLSTNFLINGYDVTIKNGIDANIPFYGVSLKDFGVIYNIGHGDYFGLPVIDWLPKTWVQTGEKYNPNNFQFGGQYFFDWLSGKIVPVTINETLGGEQKPVKYCSISEIFFKDKYSDNSFPSSFIYFANCRTFMSSNDELPCILNSKGAAVIIGWDEIHSVSVNEESGMALIDTMLFSSLDVSNALNKLPDNLKNQNNGGILSHLTYYPSSGGVIQLNTTAVPILITNNVTGITLTTALCGGNITSDGGTTVTARGVCWSTSQNPTIADNKTNDGIGIGSFTSSIAGLTTNSTYYVKAYATNSSGTAYGNQVSFTAGIIFTPGSGVTDIDGNTYATIILGTQEWMVENLKVTHFNNGDSIPLITNNWSSLSTPGYCWYNDDEATYKNTYGALYNWYTVNTSELCPTGWHVPSDSEWYVLSVYLGGLSVAGGKLKEIGTTHWNDPNTGATNEAGFTALPGGCRSTYFGIWSTFINNGYEGCWWSSTLNPYTYNSYYEELYYNFSNINRYEGTLTDNFSVRCVKDN